MKQPLFPERNAIRLYSASSLRKGLHWLGCALAAAFLVIYLSPAAWASDAAALGPEQLRSVLGQALADDHAGDHQRARAWFDALEGTSLASESAVPSAVNLVALGRFDEARKVFGRIASVGNSRDTAYAQLSLLGLTARTWPGKPAVLRRQLATQAAGLRGNDLLHQRLFDLYAGKASVEQVLDIAQAMGGDQVAIEDRLAEAGYYVGIWQQYVAKNPAAAMRLYRQALAHASVSIERPLIEQALGQSQVVSR